MFSDCIPRRQTSRPITNSPGLDKCSNVGCRTESGGSILHTAEAHQHLESLDLIGERLLEQESRPSPHPPLEDPLARKIDQLYHHSEGSHHSQHIMEHLATGTRAMPAPTYGSQRPYTIGGQKVFLRPVKQLDPRLHPLAADSKEEVNSPLDEHDLHRDSVVTIAIHEKEHDLHRDGVVPLARTQDDHDIHCDSVAPLAKIHNNHDIHRDPVVPLAKIHKDHDIHRDPVVPIANNDPRAHSLKLDEFGEEFHPRTSCELLDDPIIYREMSPKTHKEGDEACRVADMQIIDAVHPHLHEVHERALSPFIERKKASPGLSRRSLQNLKSVSPRPYRSYKVSTSIAERIQRLNTQSSFNVRKSRHESSRGYGPHDHQTSGTWRSKHSTADNVDNHHEEQIHHPSTQVLESKADAWPHLKLVHNSMAEKWPVAGTEAPWSYHLLRKAHDPENHEKHHGHQSTDLSKVRQQLRKVIILEPSSPAKPPSPPPTQWRRSLGGITYTPQGEISGRGSCGHCHPSQATSTTNEDSTPCLVVEGGDLPESHVVLSQNNAAHRDSHIRREWQQMLPSRIRVRDLEHTLARHSPEDLLRQQARRRTTQETTRKISSQFKELSPVRLRNKTPEIHSPRPFIPPDHACEWRARCMDLSSEVEQLKSEQELSEQTSHHEHYEQVIEPRTLGRIDVGVGDALAMHDCDAFGVEGLTIVLHMKGKDDLVINTDLEKGESPVGRGCGSLKR